MNTYSQRVNGLLRLSSQPSLVLGGVGNPPHKARLMVSTSYPVSQTLPMSGSLFFHLSLPLSTNGHASKYISESTQSQITCGPLCVLWASFTEHALDIWQQAVPPRPRRCGTPSGGGSTGKQNGAGPGAQGQRGGRTGSERQA